MKPSDYFKTMEEVRVFLENQKDNCTPEQYRVLQIVLGLGEQEGLFEEIDGIGKIDKSIANIIRQLNTNGFPTLASCSGLMLDHPQWETAHSGYVSFKNIKDNANIIIDSAKNLELPFKEDECYLQPSITVRFDGDEKVKKENWNQLLKNLLINICKSSSKDEL